MLMKLEAADLKNGGWGFSMAAVVVLTDILNDKVMAKKKASRRGCHDDIDI